MIKTRQKQEGVALVVSLVLLVAVTILGITTLSGTRLNHKITSNAQNKAIAFEVAESGLAAVWRQDYLLASIKDTSNALNNPVPLVRPDADTGMNTEFDITGGHGSTDIEGVLTVQYCGEGQPVGSSLNADKSNPGTVYLLVDVNSVATINNTATQADHVQRAGISSPSTGRTGACTTR